MVSPLSQNRLQAIALDLDGTLLTTQGRPSTITLKSLQDFRAGGTRLVLASGRMTTRITPIAEMVGGPLTLIAYNGARIVEWQDGKQYQATLTTEIPSLLRQGLIELCRERNLFLNVYSGNEIVGYHPRGDFRFGEIYHQQNGAEYAAYTDSSPSLPDHEVAKMLIVTEPEDREPLYRECSKLFGHLGSIVKSNPEYLEFMAPGVTKGSALRWWTQQNQIPTDSVAAFGDAENDLDMLRTVGFGIAVANCTPGLRADYSRISRYTNDEDVIVRELAAMTFSP